MDLYYTDLAQQLVTAGEDLDDLDRDLSDLSDLDHDLSDLSVRHVYRFIRAYVAAYTYIYIARRVVLLV